jgi:hypothetical protein
MQGRKDLRKREVVDVDQIHREVALKKLSQPLESARGAGRCQRQDTRHTTMRPRRYGTYMHKEKEEEEEEEKEEKKEEKKYS